MEDIENIPQKPSMRKNILKRICIILLFIIGLGLVRFFFLYLFSFLDIDTRKILLMTSCITILFMISVIFIIVSPEANKLRSKIKGILVVLGYVIGFFWGRVFFTLLLSRIMPRKNYTHFKNEHSMFMILGTVVYVLLILFILLLIKRYKSKNNKIIKWIVVNLFIILIVSWGGLTKAGIIPNWLGIEALCSCIDCEGKYFSKWEFSGIDGRECCEGTYKYYNLDRIQQDLPYGYAPDIVAKPIIYLYPTKETKVNVKLGTPKNLLHTYPKYNPSKGWNVVAQPNGDLKDMDTGRKLYALYREGKTYNETNFDEGFVVAGRDTISFLEEKLSILGLNEREAEEFIVYWLPQMENNEYNLIRFETKEEQDENMPLNITPMPDTIIRVMMDWKAIEERTDIPEQELVMPERNGFTVVEWGGSPRK